MKPYGASTTFVCRGCSRTLRSQGSLSSHEKICPNLKMGKGESFFKLAPLQTGTIETADKILPASQPLQIVDLGNNGSEMGDNTTPILNGRDTPLLENEVLEEPLCHQQDEQHLDQRVEEEENNNCPICKIDVTNGVSGIRCDMCKTWVHQLCLHMSDEDLQALTDVEWFCARCRQIKSNKIKWGDHFGEEHIGMMIQSAYTTIIGWKKNIFHLPRGKCGSDFIVELTRLVNLFVDKTKWQRLALPLIHIFIPIMLQKPSIKSKPRDNAKYLKSRLERWMSGQLKSLMDETCEIQKRLKSKKSADKTSVKQKQFVNLMLLGKLGDAAKKINNDDSVKGVHPLNDQIKDILLAKHPESRDAEPDIILPQTSIPPQPVMFEEITAETVYKTAKRMRGSGGPTLIDSDIWKQFLCSRAFGNAATDLCQAIADFTKILCTEDIHQDCLTEFVASRLVPLDKGDTKDGMPGVRPVGIGEVLRRLTGKLLISVIREEVTTAAGPLQTCTGLNAGIEAAIHAMKHVFEDSGTEGILLVDAENAFNNLNRKAAISNIKELCPPFHQYLNNTYQKPASLVIPGEQGYEIIYSEEGCVQGVVDAMDMYGVATKPLVEKLSTVVSTDLCKQVWYADDSSAGGKLLEIKKWWTELCNTGPKYGYYPLASKTILIVKPEHQQMAEEIFNESGIKITVEGERHMGAVIGSEEFKVSYVNSKINKWIVDVEELSTLAMDEPQAVYSCFTKAISHRWTYVQRTIPDIENLFRPLEEAIRDKLIPALIGRNVSDIERRILALPVRYGGLGIANPTNSSMEYSASTAITHNLTQIIYNQESDFSNYDNEGVKRTIKEMKAQKEEKIKQELEAIRGLVDDKMKRTLDLAQEKGSGAWLTALPVQSYGYTLNKQEFRDSVCLRYGWNIPNTPSFCQCKKENNIDHALNCKLGGYVGMRHNRVRDLEAALMKEVCHNVQIEPELLPLGNDNTRSGNVAEKARLDVAGVGVWGTYEKTFLDIRIMHPNSPSYANKSIQQVYAAHEQEKKRCYNERVLQVERGSFTPIVGSTSGGWGKEADMYHKRIATLIALKRNEEYADVMNYIRTRLRFCLLKSVLTAVRGVRGSLRTASPISTISFNLVGR